MTVSRIIFIICIVRSTLIPFAISMIPKSAYWISRKPPSHPITTSSHFHRLFAAKSNDQSQPQPPPPTPRGFKPPVPSRSQNLLIVGLGNPGSDYDGTRHNVGFAALDAFAAMHPGGVLKATSKFGADYGAIRVGTKNVGLLKPTTYINNSGKPLLAIMKHFKLTAADILVLADDVALDCGDIKLKERGSHGKSLDGSIVETLTYPYSTNHLARSPHPLPPPFISIYPYSTNHFDHNIPFNQSRHIFSITTTLYHLLSSSLPPPSDRRTQWIS